MMTRFQMAASLVGLVTVGMVLLLGSMPGLYHFHRTFNIAVARQFELRPIRLFGIPDAQIVSTRPDKRDNRDDAKRNYLISIHGYNVDQASAIAQFDEEYKRLFWIGFRGNFSGLTWKGDLHFFRVSIREGKRFRLTTETTADFHIPMRNALHSSFFAMRFMETVNAWSGSSKRVNVMAHSLGNLVMWDAARIYGRYVDAGQGGRVKGGLVNNIISNEAAIWEEAFQEETPLVYKIKGAPGRTPGYDADTPIAGKKTKNEIVYPTDPSPNPKPPPNVTVDGQKQHCWRFWLKPTGHDPRIALAGRPYHSFVPKDYALNIAMRIFDKIHYGGTAHYDRDVVHNAGQYREPVNGKNLKGEALFLFDLPALMQNRTIPPFFYPALNRASGQVENPLAAPTNLNATGFGWRADPGPPVLRLLDSGVRNHSDFMTLPFYEIYPWWDNYLGEGRNNGAWAAFPPTIPIGQEGR